MSAFYHCIVHLTPLYCRTNIEHIVISEDPLEFQERNEGIERYGGLFQLVSFREISEELYNKRKSKNPRKDTKWYRSDIRLKTEDWGKE